MIPYIASRAAMWSRPRETTISALRSWWGGQNPFITDFDLEEAIEEINKMEDDSDIEIVL